MAIEDRTTEENFKRLFPKFYQKMEEMIELKSEPSAPKEKSKEIPPKKLHREIYPSQMAITLSKEDHLNLKRLARKTCLSLAAFMRIQIQKILHG